MAPMTIREILSPMQESRTVSVKRDGKVIYTGNVWGMFNNSDIDLGQVPLSYYEVGTIIVIELKSAS